MTGRIIEIKSVPVFFIPEKYQKTEPFEDVVCYFVYESKNAINGFPKELVNEEDERNYDGKGAFLGTVLTNSYLSYDANISMNLDSFDIFRTPCIVDTISENDWVDTGCEMSIEEAFPPQQETEIVSNLEELFYYGDYPCVIRSISNNLGRYYCGYVGIPKNHPLYSFSHYQDIPIRCHGGVSYDGYRLDDVDIIEFRWVGFSYAQIGDRIRYPFGQIADVRKECENIVQQILNLKE